ncbi:hypothetical protein LDENG_00176920 [Lucifuga dentata]|nr:hypothetical protein LDENG_00176920 [Lucifuga dentata]
MIVSNITCMKTEYIRLKHAKWVVWSFKTSLFFFHLTERTKQMSSWHPCCFPLCLAQTQLFLNSVIPNSDFSFPRFSCSSHASSIF